MPSRMLLLALVGLLAPLPLPAEGFPVAASCPDGSVYFAQRPEDVGCEDAIHFGPEGTPRVGQAYYRRALRARQLEEQRERYLERLLEASEPETSDLEPL